MEPSCRETGGAVAGFAGITLVLAKTGPKSFCLWDDGREWYQPQVRGFQWGGTWPGTQLHVQTTYSAAVKSSCSPELALEDASQHPKTAALGFPFLPALAPGWAPGEASVFASDYRALGGQTWPHPSSTGDLLFTLDPFQAPYSCSSGLSLSQSSFIWEVSDREEEVIFVMRDWIFISHSPQYLQKEQQKAEGLWPFTCSAGFTLQPFKSINLHWQVWNLMDSMGRLN